jgi:prophage DNA circulation protein
MAYDALSAARQNFNTFGSSLASIEQNAQDDANANTQTSQIYQQTLAQLNLEGPQALAFGGMEAIRQSSDLYDRLRTVSQKIKELPSTLTDIGTRTVAKLSDRAQQAKDIYDTAKSKLSGTLEDVQAHADTVSSQAKGIFKGATKDLQDSANLDELKTNFTNLKTDLTGRLAKANDIIDSNVKQYSDLADQAKSQIGEIQTKMDALRSSATGDLTG